MEKGQFVIALIAVVLTAIGMIGALIGFVIRMSHENGKRDEKFDNMEQKIEDLKQAIKDNQEHDRKDLSELYDFQKSTMKTLAEVTTLLQVLNGKIDKLEEKIDKKEGRE